MTYDCRIYVCILLLVLQNVLPSKKKPESRSLSLRRKRSFCAAHEKEDFLLHFASLLSTKIIHQIKSLQNVFHLCHSRRRFCVQREQGKRFRSRRSLSVFLFLLSLPRSASLCEGLWLRCFSLSLSRIDFSQQGNPRWQKYGSSSRDLSRVPFTSPFSRASLRDRDSGGFLLFSFILFSRNEAARDDILPPSATFTGKKTRKR